MGQPLRGAAYRPRVGRLSGGRCSAQKASGVEVTGVDGPGKLDVMRDLGADRVIDFTAEDFTRSGEQYDLILDVVCHRSIADYRRALRPGGRCGVIGGGTGRLVGAAALGQALRLSEGRRVGLVMYRANRPDAMDSLVRLIGEGSVKPVIDRLFPLEEAVTPWATTSVGRSPARSSSRCEVDPRRAERSILDSD